LIETNRTAHERADLVKKLQVQRQQHVDAIRETGEVIRGA